jgi:MoxR-like ATPase
LKLQESGNYVLPFPLEKVRAKGVRRRYTEEIPSRWMPLTSEQEQANRSFFNYFNEVKLHLLERDTLIEHLQLGYLLKEPVNIQMLGEAGVAKTQVATKIMGRMTDEHGQSSFFRQQMGVNTTIGELIGTVKQSGLKEDRIIRAAERGLPGFENSFLDEYYNAPADTRHDLLTLQAEGLITMGGETYKSKSRMTLYASNKYPDQVFFDAGNDTPRAEMDRMLFTHIVSPTFEYDENMLDLEQLRQAPLKASLTFQEIDQLRGLADRIEIPRYYLAKTKLVINRLRQNEIKREHDSKIEWLRRDHHGEVNLTPPTYMARVLSPRSEKRAYQLLKVFALADWLAAKANGAMVSPEPEITEVHFARLVEFFVYNGPSDEHIERILREYPKGSIPHQQFLNLRQRRQEFFELLAVTAGDLSMEQPMKELHQFLEALNIGAGGLEFAVLKLDAKHRLNDRNAPVVNALIKWHKQLGERIAAKDKIKEVTTSDVALLQAHDLGGRLIHKLMEPRKR